MRHTTNCIAKLCIIFFCQVNCHVFSNIGRRFQECTPFCICQAQSKAAGEEAASKTQYLTVQSDSRVFGFTWKCCPGYMYHPI